MTCSTQLSGAIHPVPSLAFSNTGAPSATVTPTMMACSTTTPSTQSARMKSMPVSRRADGAGGGAAAGSAWTMAMSPPRNGVLGG
ncbi:hypothetical protein [Microbacterium sp. K41]|uniref:hypothetical protein n=1 Tax=Microbacterium sp. K41 TaxID=2305437 RepID=UPI001F0EEB7D|nr:hypothetical protein [Microbacterium sp. K41]